MNKKDNIYKLICIAAATICTIISIISLYLLFTGKTPAPTSSLEPANWSGNLYGRFFGAARNPNFCAIIASIGIISLAYLAYLSLKNAKTKVAKFFLFIICLILAVINIFVCSISANTAIIVILLLVFLILLFYFFWIYLKNKVMNKKKLFVETFLSSCFVCLLLWGALYDMTIAYKVLENTMPTMQENAYVLDKNDVIEE